MEYVMLGLLALANVLLAAVLIRQTRHKPRDNTRELQDWMDQRLDAQSAEYERRLAEAKAELSAGTLSAARSMGDGVQNAVRNMGAMLSETQANQTRVMEHRLRTLEASNEQKLDNMRAGISAGMEAMRADNAKKLEEIRRTVDEELQDTLQKRVSESFKAVSAQLEQVYKGLGEMQNLAADVGGLKQVLAGVKTRGILGEAVSYTHLTLPTICSV